MALTVSGVSGTLPFVRGERTDSLVFGTCSITPDSSYPTGGEALAASAIDSNLNELIGVFCLSVSGTNTNKVYYCAYDTTNGKLLLFDEAGESPNTTDNSSAVLFCMYVGR
jgi:hypothetical protein